MPIAVKRLRVIENGKHAWSDSPAGLRCICFSFMFYCFIVKKLFSHCFTMSLPKTWMIERRNISLILFIWILLRNLYILDFILKILWTFIFQYIPYMMVLLHFTLLFHGTFNLYFMNGTLRTIFNEYTKDILMILKNTFYLIKPMRTNIVSRAEVTRESSRPRTGVPGLDSRGLGNARAKWFSIYLRKGVYLFYLLFFVCLQCYIFHIVFHNEPTPIRNSIVCLFYVSVVFSACVFGCVLVFVFYCACVLLCLCFVFCYVFFLLLWNE